MKEEEIFTASALGDIQKALEDLNKPKPTNHLQEEVVEDFIYSFIYLDFISVLVNLGEPYHFSWSSGEVKTPSDSALDC